MKKTIYVLNMILTALITAVAILILLSTVIAKSQGRVPAIFGHTFHLVVSPSMEPDIKVGDFVVAKKNSIDDVKLGDYVVFRSPDPDLKGMIIIHSVVEINETDEGKELVTSGIKEGASRDKYPVKEIIGIYRSKSTFIGKIMLFFTDMRNLIFLGIMSIALILIVKYSVSIFEQLNNKNNSSDKQ